MGGEDRDNREAKQVSRERNNWSGRRGGEEESEEESNTEDSLGISVGKERNPAVKRRWCVGEGKGIDIAVVVCRSSDFFMEAVGWGLWAVATVTWRGEERETEVRCAQVRQESEEPRRKKGTW